MRQRALRPQLKRDPLGRALCDYQYSYMRLLLRNAAIGAAFLSYKALFDREYAVFALLCGLGALSGVLYTLLAPLLRKRPRLHYLPWILCAYFAIGGIIVVGVRRHDPMSNAVLESPWGVGFFLVAGALAAYAVARIFEDKTD